VEIAEITKSHLIDLYHELATKAHFAVDDSEACVGEGKSEVADHYKVPKRQMQELSEVLDKMDELPQPGSGVILNAPDKVQYWMNLDPMSKSGAAILFKDRDAAYQRLRAKIREMQDDAETLKWPVMDNYYVARGNCFGPQGYTQTASFNSSTEEKELEAFLHFLVELMRVQYSSGESVALRHVQLGLYPAINELKVDIRFELQPHTDRTYIYPDQFHSL
jgi:ABC-type glycerol-3-phosphate transport system substrate-binding protein